MNSIETSIAERIVARRKALNMSQAALAEAVGMAQPSLARTESGHTRRPRFLPDIARALGVNLIWLLYGTGPEDAAERPLDEAVLHAAAAGAFTAARALAGDIDADEFAALVVAVYNDMQSQGEKGLDPTTAAGSMLRYRKKTIKT